MDTLAQDEQGAVMDRLVWEPQPAELLSDTHIKQVTHCELHACCTYNIWWPMHVIQSMAVALCGSS